MMTFMVKKCKLSLLKKKYQTTKQGNRSHRENLWYPYSGVSQSEDIPSRWNQSHTEAEIKRSITCVHCTWYSLFATLPWAAAKTNLERTVKSLIRTLRNKMRLVGRTGLEETWSFSKKCIFLFALEYSIILKNSHSFRWIKIPILKTTSKKVNFSPTSKIISLTVNGSLCTLNVRDFVPLLNPVALRRGNTTEKECQLNSTVANAVLPPILRMLQLRRTMTEIMKIQDQTCELKRRSHSARYWRWSWRWISKREKCTSKSTRSFASVSARESTQPWEKVIESRYSQRSVWDDFRSYSR